MNEEKFFGHCINGSIRKEVADKLLPRLMEKFYIKKENYLGVEDIICDFLKEQTELIFRFKDLEYLKEDCQFYLDEEGYSDVPEELLERVANKYDDILNDTSLYADARDASFNNVRIAFKDELAPYRDECDGDEEHCPHGCLVYDNCNDCPCGKSSDKDDVPQDDEDIEEDLEGPNSPFRKSIQCETCNNYYNICADSGRSCSQLDGMCQSGNAEYWASVDEERKLKEDN